jgi:hypothetical protein
MIPLLEREAVPIVISVCIHASLSLCGAGEPSQAIVKLSQ